MPRLPRGLFITLEGGDGSGKSTQARALAQLLREGGYAVVLTGEPAGSGLRRVVTSLLEWLGSRTEASAISPRTEMLVFEARRAEHVQQVIRPALQRGDIVLCDRFTDSTLAYQGYGRGLEPADIETCNRIATGGLVPDLTLLLDLPPEAGLARASASGGPGEGDWLGGETLEFHTRVRAGYLALAKAEPERIAVIDASPSPAEVTEAAWERVQALLPR